MTQGTGVKTVVVIGAGFCGTALAVQLLRRAGDTPLRVLLLNRSGLMARGVAYGTRTDTHLLNVPAGRMSALPEDPGSFLRFVQGRDPRLTGAAFVPRRWFGDYLEWLLAEAAREAPANVSFRAMVGDAVHLGREGERTTVHLASGEQLVADTVVLALGHFAPAHPPLADTTLFSSPRYVRDPWLPDALWGVAPTQPVLLLGTGLTMLDVLLSLRARGHTGTVYALSRRGLLPQAHRQLETAPRYSPRLARRLANEPSVRAALREVREAIRAAEAQGTDWREVIGSLREATPAIWQQWPLAERQRFLRHLKTHWEVHRHRCAPPQNAALCEEISQQRLHVLAGRLVAASETLEGLKLQWQPRGGTALASLPVGAVINCTGPAANLKGLREPLITGLLQRGVLCSDALGLGLDIDSDYRPLNAQGAPNAGLCYVGPLLKSHHWEATAVPELAQHVARLSTLLLR